MTPASLSIAVDPFPPLLPPSSISSVVPHRRRLHHRLRSLRLPRHYLRRPLSSTDVIAAVRLAPRPLLMPAPPHTASPPRRRCQTPCPILPPFSPPSADCLDLGADSPSSPPSSLRHPLTAHPFYRQTSSQPPSTPPDAASAPFQSLLSLPSNLIYQTSSSATTPTHCSPVNSPSQRPELAMCLVES